MKVKTYDSINSAQLEVNISRYTNFMTGRAPGLPALYLVVDEDQSDNLPISYPITDSGMAQRTQANVAAFPSASTIRCQLRHHSNADRCLTFRTPFPSPPI